MIERFLRKDLQRAIQLDPYKLSPGTRPDSLERLYRRYLRDNREWSTIKSSFVQPQVEHKT